jgi:hypothetical protein
MYFRRNITTTRLYTQEVNQQIIAEKGKSVGEGKKSRGHIGLDGKVTEYQVVLKVVFELKG